MPRDSRTGFWPRLVWTAFVLNLIAAVFLSPITQLRTIKVQGAAPAYKPYISSILRKSKAIPALRVEPFAVESQVLASSAVESCDFRKNIFGSERCAETLALVVLAQIVNPGCGVVYCGRLGMLEPRTGLIWGGVELGLSSAGTVQLGHYYGFSVNVYGFSTNAHTLDAQNAFERGLNATIPALAGADELSGIGEMEAGVMGSYAQIVLDNELVGNVMRLLRSLCRCGAPRGGYHRQRHGRYTQLSRSKTYPQTFACRRIGAYKTCRTQLLGNMGRQIGKKADGAHHSNLFEGKL